VDVWVLEYRRLSNEVDFGS